MGNARITWVIAALLFQTVTSVDVNPFLVGGTPAVIGNFPSHVGINIGPSAFCGGTILSNNHILTSGSCVLDAQNNLIAANQLSIRAGVITIDATTPTVLIDRIFVHPHYNPFTFENDIAVIRTLTQLQFPVVAQPHIAPAELALRIIPENSVCQVAGWNWIQGVPSIALQQLPVTIYGRAACNVMFNGMIRDPMICATTATTAQALCVPNRGGGLYCDGRLAGIASFGFGCAANATATVFTQVRYYDQWIQQQFTRSDNPPPGPTPMPGIGRGSSMFNLSMVAILFASLIIMLVR
ncbi:trypsin-like [Ochlerotatus camptorhynchus]|uniref:trypsin-like n=1 Tax=Ochlerotatus camptorhynchus TaxID=644619 RepID=UPI0031D761BF